MPSSISIGWCHVMRMPSRTSVRLSIMSSHHDGDLFHREVRDNLDLVVVDDQHLLDPHAPLVLLAVLGLQREDHARPDLERAVERPDSRDYGQIVLCQTEPVPPEHGRRLVILLVAPRLL